MQDKTIVQIGRVKMPSLENGYQFFIQNMFPGENYEMIAADFNLEEIEGSLACNFAGVEIDAVSSKNYLRYAYRKGSSRGGDITFTTKSGDFDKKLRTIQKLISDTILFCKSHNIIDELPVFRSLNTTFKKEYSTILKAVSEKHKGLDKEKQQKSGFTIRFRIKGEERYLADFETIRQQIIRSGTEGKSEKYDVISEAKNKICSICLERKPLVHGFASPFKFATVDKPGFVSGFFRQENNWKNYPICSDCALSFEMGRNYIIEHLSRSFYGRFYLIIPKLVLYGSSDFYRNILDTLARVKFTEDSKNIGANEDYIMREVAREFGEENGFSLNLLFYEENSTTKAIKIKLNLEEIVPSRFRVIFEEIPNQLRTYSIYENAVYTKKGQKEDLIFSFSILRDFFDDKFYQIIQIVFEGLNIDREVLFKAFMDRYREHRKKEKEGKGYFEFGDLTIKKAHMILSYFKELDLIRINKDIITMESSKLITNYENAHSDEEKKEYNRSFDIAKYRNFVAENPGFLDSEIKEGIFSLGVLTRLLFNLQSANLGGGTPFEKKLKGFHLNSDALLKIYWEVLNKINQYTSLHAYGDFKLIVADKFVRNVHLLKEISNNEMSFYFVSGIELGKMFKNE